MQKLATNVSLVVNYMQMHDPEFYGIHGIILLTIVNVIRCPCVKEGLAS